MLYVTNTFKKFPANLNDGDIIAYNGTGGIAPEYLQIMQEHHCTLVNMPLSSFHIAGIIGQYVKKHAVRILVPGNFTPVIQFWRKQGYDISD